MQREWRQLKRMPRDCKEERQYMYLSTKSFPGERRLRENRRSHVSAVERVDMCLVLAIS